MTGDSAQTVAYANGTGARAVGALVGRNPGWSRDGRSIAFVSNGLHTVDVDGSDRRRLTSLKDGSDTVSDPAWSPDGKRIVFSADSMPRSSVERLEVINADGSRRRVLVEKHGPGFRNASWSPDGSAIAFSAGGGYYGTWIGVVRPDGSGYRRIARHCSGGSPEWSPDGSRIVFSDSHGLIVMNADGSNMRRIPNTWDGRTPAWSPDGKRLAFFRL